MTNATAKAIDNYFAKHTEKVGFSVLNQMKEGADQELAVLVTAALLPPIGHFKLQGDTAYYQELRQEAWAFAKASKKLRKNGAADNEKATLAIATLNR